VHSSSALREDLWTEHPSSPASVTVVGQLVFFAYSERLCAKLQATVTVREAEVFSPWAPVGPLGPGGRPPANYSVLRIRYNKKDDLIFRQSFLSEQLQFAVFLPKYRTVLSYRRSFAVNELARLYYLCTDSL